MIFSLSNRHIKNEKGTKIKVRQQASMQQKHRQKIVQEANDHKVHRPTSSMATRHDHLVASQPQQQAGSHSHNPAIGSPQQQSQDQNNNNSSIVSQPQPTPQKQNHSSKTLTISFAANYRQGVKQQIGNNINRSVIDNKPIDSDSN